MVFADSSGFVAAFDARDQRHEPAAAAWREVIERRERVATTQLVLAETVTYLRRRAGYEASRRVGDAVLGSSNIDVLPLDDDQLVAARRHFLRDADPKLSLCDAASFIIMRDLGLTRALTFDRHFAEAGFEILDNAR